MKFNSKSLPELKIGHFANLPGGLTVTRLKDGTLATSFDLSSWTRCTEPDPAVTEQLVAALRNAIDSLEYVQTAMPGAIGYGVRHERIISARAALTAAGAA